MSKVDRIRRKLLDGSRALAPNLPVTRTVQGVTLHLPWNHRLPDYARSFPAYGQNLVALASALASRRMDPLRVIDIGANVGDSALQMLRANDCRILCVEGDDHWVKWLRRNTVSDARITIEPSLVTSGKIPYLAPVRARGTTQFKPAAVAGARTVTPRELRNRHAAFVDVDLIKIDTDGYDCVLVPALASVWIASSPALFFEFDPDMTLSLGQVDPWRVFGELSTLGYVSGIVWDNFGGLIGSGSLTQCAQLCAPLREARERREFDYVDIAVAGAEKGAVLQAMM